MARTLSSNSRSGSFGFDIRGDDGGDVAWFSDASLWASLAARGAHASAAPPVSSAGAYAGVSSEQLVNQTVVGAQSEQKIIALASGGYVIVWTDASGVGGDASGSAIKAQVYGSGGAKSGGEFLVNTTTTGAQSAASISALSTGGFVVTWTDASATGADPSQLAVRGQMFDAGGVKAGGEFVVNTTTLSNQSAPSVTSLASGGFVVSWMDASGTAPDPRGTGIRAQVYTSSGVKLGGEFLVNTVTVGSQTAPAIAGLASGGFVATWVDASNIGGDTSSLGVKGQLFSATGAKLGGEFLVNTETAESQNQVSVSALANGGFVAVWRDLSLHGDTSGSGIKGQVFTASGARVGGEFQVNATEYNTQDQPTVTALPGGGFAVSWRDNSNLAADSSGFGIKTQIFDDAGNRRGVEFQANTTTLGNQASPAIAALSSGEIVVSWMDASGLDGDLDGGIKIRTFHPYGGAITGLALSSSTFSEAEVENTTVATLQGAGALNAAYSYQIIDDSTGGGFTIVGNQLIVQDSLAFDYEAGPSVTLTVRVTDTFGHSFDRIFVVALQDSAIEDRYVAGPETLGNTIVAASQQQSSLAALADGRFLLTWADGSGVGGDASGYGVKAQLLSASGAKLGGEFLVNSQTQGSQDGAVSTGLASGGFVIAWSDWRPVYLSALGRITKPLMTKNNCTPNVPRNYGCRTAAT